MLLIDDDPTARRALRDAALGIRGLVITAEGSSGVDVLGRFEAVSPDVVVIDVDMPDVDGVTATLRLTRRHPGVSVLLLTAREDDELSLLALRAGAAGVLSKGIQADAILRATRSVGRGEAAISRRLTRRLVESYRAVASGAPRTRPIESVLTTREWQVLDLLEEGASTEAIAARLVVSIDTVRSHVKHILRKLGAHSRHEAVRAAARLRTGGDGGRHQRGMEEGELHRRLADLGVLRQGG